MISWSLVFLLSIVSGALIWYIREMIKRFRFLSDNSFILKEKVERYRTHLTAVYELPTFYGDETMRGLMAHTQDLIADLQELEEVFFLADVGEEEYNAEEEES
tara:strand:+ start:6022 stop:6330 length:309 start_codon:yes stop_codon:yes gene_type:complete